jgi:hypothetical protein
VSPAPPPAAPAQTPEATASGGPPARAPEPATTLAVPAEDPAQAAAEAGASGAPAAPAEAPQAPGFRSRGRARRRARFLRRARELAYRDLGGLVFNLHRFGQRNDPLVLAKLNTLVHLDGELRAVEALLHERQPLTVLREAGITACPRCAAIHSSEDNFCPNCGLPVDRHVDLPAGFQSGGAPVAQAPTPAAATGQPATPPAQPPSEPAPPSGPAPPSEPAPARAPDGPTEIIRPQTGLP